MVQLLARVIGSGIATADMLVHEILSRNLRDRKAVARGACPRAGQGPDPGAGLTGSPDESGARRREKGLARAGNPRVPHGTSPWAKGPRGMIQLAWRFLMFPKNSALAQWYHMQTADRRGTTRKTMIPAFARTALARKRLVALWQRVTTGEVPEGVVLRSAA
jgi:transposase